MNSSAHNRLFGPGGCLTSRAIRSYLDSSLPPGGRIQVEEHVKKCRLCAGALEGFKHHGRGRYINRDLAILSKRIRRTYSGGSVQPDRKLPLLVLFSFIAFLFIVLGVFYVFRQDMLHRKGEIREKPDTVIEAVKVLPDSSGRSALSPTGVDKRNKR
jgi:hypothetical protein